LVKVRSPKARSPAEKFRDVVLLGYPEWPGWSRKLRRIFVCLPSYGVGKESFESMCEDFGWDYAATVSLINRSVDFKKAIKEFVDDGYRYRTVAFPRQGGGMLTPEPIRWSVLQQVYMMESGITSFIKAETGRISAPEGKLIEKIGLLEVEPMVSSDPFGAATKTGKGTIDISGEASLYDLESSLNGR